jgi:hypothetical protein
MVAAPSAGSSFPRAKLAKLQAMGTKALDIIEESLSHHNL